MQFTYQMFRYFHHGIVYFHPIVIMRCIVYIIYHYRLILLSPNNPCGQCSLFVAGATLNKIDLILSFSVTQFAIASFKFQQTGTLMKVVLSVTSGLVLPS